MAKFYGEVGYAEHTFVNGVTEETIVKKYYYGDILRTARGLELGDKVIPDISLDNSISIVADAYANEHFFAIRYVEWAGVRWSVENVQVSSPRLILRLGGVYNGPED